MEHTMTMDANAIEQKIKEFMAFTPLCLREEVASALGYTKLKRVESLSGLTVYAYPPGVDPDEDMALCQEIEPVESDLAVAWELIPRSAIDVHWTPFWEAVRHSIPQVLRCPRYSPQECAAWLMGHRDTAYVARLICVCRLVAKEMEKADV